jgi:copper chaperone
MEETQVHIPAISCHHCRMTIERELGELEGIESVEVDVDSRTALIRWEAPLTWDEIKETLTEIGYPPEE